MEYKIEIFKLSNTIDSVVFMTAEIYPFIEFTIVNDLTKKLVVFREKAADYYLEYGIENVTMELVDNIPRKYIDTFVNS